MNIDLVRLVYFSPTGTTRRILQSVARGIAAASAQEIDLTAPDVAGYRVEQTQNAITVLGAPVYGGRIPPEAVRRLRATAGAASPAVVVAVYGNRAYEDALLELRDLALELGFVPIAAGAFVGEHSFHTDATPIAGGRPDATDLQQAQRFGRDIKDKLTRACTISELGPVSVPGMIPYKVRKDRPAMAPATSAVLCNLCGACAEVCPTAAISVGDAVATDDNACILCSACIKRCPTGARLWHAQWVQQAATWLSANCPERKEPEVFL
jgi:ferredoxin